MMKSKPEFLKEWVNMPNFRSSLRFLCGLFILIGFYCMAFSMMVFEWIGKAYKAGKQGKD